MGKTYDAINERLRTFIEAQHMFFVATAPLDADGHVNVSPKGLDSFRILAPKRVAYADFVGSGVETISHLRENGRIVLLFCAFEGAPKIVRLHGHGRVVEPGDDEFGEIAKQLPAPLPLRSAIVVDLTRISDSCGYSVPLYDYRGQRKTLIDWADAKGDAGRLDYQRKKNAHSLDGLPGLRWVQNR